MSNLGFIGLGIMGGPMAGHLQKAGHQLYLNSRSGAPQNLLDGGGVECANGKEVAEQAWASRPFASIEELHEAMFNVVKNASREEQVTFLNNHPELAGKEAQAVADVSVPVFNAVRDLKEGRWEGGTHHKIGLEDPAAVRLELADSVPDAVKARVEEYAEGIRTGQIEIPTNYDGPEFEAN